MYSEGLLLLTNDGDFANAVMHPSHEVSKTYRTWVTGEAPEKAAHALRRPMEIDGYTIRPAGVDIVQCFPGGALLSITIREGRNRQVRKMCEKVGLKVTRSAGSRSRCLSRMKSSGGSSALRARGAAT